MSKILASFIDFIDIRSPPPTSSVGIKYSELREHPLHSGHVWLESKRETDGAEQLWRVHNGLYDLSEFVRAHPGGSEWLEMTKGTDITEAFESHHLTTIPEGILKKYYVREAVGKRNTPFTFDEDGFYKVLKKRIAEELKNIPPNAALRSKVLTDALLATFLGTSFLSAAFESFLLGVVAGVFLSLTAIASHNFFHQRNNFRMYYFDFTMMHYKEWRISHALSHHLYTNTINDLEISSLEPYVQYLPAPKKFAVKYLSWFYSPIMYALMFVGHFIKTVIQKLILKEPPHPAQFLPFLLLLAMMLASPKIWMGAILFLWIIVVGSVYFSVVGVNAAHHHPEIFHDGDAPRPVDEQDWGVFQMDAVMDRKDITGSHFLVLTNFGDHALHHLFPTIDHGKLEWLYPVFLKTCEEFGMEWRLRSQLELVKGQYLQCARTEPNTKPRSRLKKGLK